VQPSQEGVALLLQPVALEISHGQYVSRAHRPVKRHLVGERIFCIGEYLPS
jgi:hypothetical protein